MSPSPADSASAALRRYAAAIGYGALVFAGSALLGFVIAPWLGSASGAFPIEAEARAFFSLLTLAGVPYLAGLCVLSGALHPKLAGRRLRVRIALFGLNVLVAWLCAASIALAILG